MLTLTHKSNLPSVSGMRPDVNISYLDYKPNWSRMEELSARYRIIEKIILVGNGGSINTFRGVYGALKNKVTPEAVFVDTNEPGFLKQVLNSSKANKTLLISLSKSGENISQIEATLYLYGIDNKIFITGSKGVLREIANLDNSVEMVDHPEIGGRFTAFTEVNLLPAMLCGFDAHDFVPTNEVNYLSNLAWELSSYLWEIEQNGIDQVFVYTYGNSLNNFGQFIQQITHETFGKNRKGLTFVPVAAPEAQHHTNQRIFGGPSNAAILFVKVNPSSNKLQVPQSLSGIKVRGKELGMFDEFDLARSFEAEYAGVQERADEMGLPNITLEISDIQARSLGEYAAFWHLMAIYSANLRGVNPFDQPDVEASKEISFEKRFS